jgi:hypothetical protein
MGPVPVQKSSAAGANRQSRYTSILLAKHSVTLRLTAMKKPGASVCTGPGQLRIT